MALEEPATSLVRARELMAAGDYAGAATAALQATTDEATRGQAYLVLGLAYFRDEKYPEALAAFASSRASSTPPDDALLSFNEASALFALERYAEAERSFTRAAAMGTKLAALATLNAGIAAFRTGDRSRARAHLEALPALPGAGAVKEDADVLRADVAAADAVARVAEAEETFTAAMDSYRRDDPAAARNGLMRALSLGLDAENTALAHDYLDLLSRGLRMTGRGWAISAGAGGGYDSNVAHMGLVLSEALGPKNALKAGAPFATATFDASYGHTLGPRVFARGAYFFDHLVYLDQEFESFDLQLHSLAVRVEAGSFGALRLGLDGGYDVQLTGLSSFTPFLGIATVEPSLSLDEGERASTILRVRVQHRSALDRTAEPYAGTRLDVKLAERLRWRAFRAQLALRHRRDDLGFSEVDLGMIKKSKVSGVYTTPYSCRANAAMAQLDLKVGGVRIGFDGTFELVHYTDDNVLTSGGGSAGELERVRRADTRITVGTSVAVPLGDTFELELRPDLFINRSTVDFAFDNKNFIKYSVALELTADW